MTVVDRTRWYVRLLQFSPVIAGLLLAAVWLAVPVGLRAQIDTVREYRAIAAENGTASGSAFDERLAAEQWMASARDHTARPPGSAMATVTPAASADFGLWARVQVFLALRQAQFLGGAAMLLAMAIVASPAAFLLERRRVTQLSVLEEMERVQQDAHDKVYNRLSALSKRVEIAGESLSSEVGRSLEQVADDIRDTVAELQDILGDARQRTASITGSDPLRSQLESVAREQSARLGIAVALDVAGDLPALSGQTGWDLQCVFEEAINNAVEHGGAARVDASVRVDGDTLALRIADDGSGMPATDIDAISEEHLGLRGMRARAERHGGTFVIEPAGAGAAVVIRMPVKRNQGEP